MTERLFTEAQWRAIAKVEGLTESKPSWDAFHFWSQRKRILGGAFSGGEFFLGQRSDGTEFRVFERMSGLDFSCEDSRELALSVARGRLARIGDHLATLLAEWTALYEPFRLEWEKEYAQKEALAAIAKARAEAPRKIGKRARAVFEASEGKCHYCQTVLTLDGRWHIEHKVPRALFGGSEQSNLVAACAPCNHAKRDKTDLEFIALRQDSGQAV